MSYFVILPSDFSASNSSEACNSSHIFLQVTLVFSTPKLKKGDILIRDAFCLPQKTSGNSPLSLFVDIPCWKLEKMGGQTGRILILAMFCRARLIQAKGGNACFSLDGPLDLLLMVFFTFRRVADKGTWILDKQRCNETKKEDAVRNNNKKPIMFLLKGSEMPLFFGEEWSDLLKACDQWGIINGVREYQCKHQVHNKDFVSFGNVFFKQ